jgi:hypothetical protein
MARVSPSLLVQSLTAPAPVDALPQAAAAGAGSAANPACVIAQDLYYREATSLSVWSVLTWSLGAGTVVFGLLILVLLSSVVFQTSEAIDKAVKIAGTLGSALATWQAGKGTKFVFDRLKDQRTVVSDCLTTVKGNCDPAVAQAAENEVKVEKHTPI